METPGPMVEQMVALLTYFPLARAGFALITAVIRLAAFSTSFSAGKLTLPTGAWMIPVLSTRNSTLPALISLIALVTSTVTVPVFGLGMRPLGPRTLPSLPTERIMSGGGDSGVQGARPPDWILVFISS